MKLLRIWLIVVVTLFIAGLFYFSESFTVVASASGAENGEADIGASFTLTDQNGKKVSDKDFGNKLRLVYFGFTNCPGVCPVDMAMLTEVLKKLGGDADKIAPIFITVDPKRDNPKQLKKFLKDFYPGFTGLTGSEKEIEKVEKGYKVYAAESSAPGIVNHSSNIYLMDKNGKYITHFSPGADEDAIIKEIKKHI